MRGLLAATAISATGCVPIDGGAVEVRWTIHKQEADPQQQIEEGDRIGCDTADITTVSLLVDPGSAEGPTFEFDCDDGRGSSEFDISPGRHLFDIAPGGPGADVATVPGPISAVVREGEVTDLQVLLIRVP